MSKLRAAIGAVFWTMIFSIGLIFMSSLAGNAGDLQFLVSYFPLVWIKNAFGFGLGLAVYVLLTKLEQKGSGISRQTGLLDVVVNLIGLVLLVIALLQAAVNGLVIFELFTQGSAYDPTLGRMFSIGIIILDISSTASIGLAVLFGARWLSKYRNAEPPEETF